jgi:quinolinate synthase
MYAASRTGKKIHIWDGYCPIHERLTLGDVQRARQMHPDAEFMAHPECRPEILEAADVIASTSGMIRHAGRSRNRAFIVGTEVGLLHPLKKTHPAKSFFPVSEKMICPDMKKITPKDVLKCLETFQVAVEVPESIRLPALRAVERMLEVVP